MDRDFHRQPAGLKDAFLYEVDTVFEVHVARLQIRPSIQDCDDGLSIPVL